MSVKLGSFWIDNDSDLLVIVKSLEGHYDGKVKVIFNYIIRTGDKSVESASELDLFLKTKTKLVKSIEGDYSKGFKKGKDFNNDYRAGYNDGWRDCEASFELGNEFTDSIQEQAYDEGYEHGVQHMNMQDSIDKYLEMSDNIYFTEDEVDNIIDDAFEEGYAQACSELQAKTERERALQEKAWDEGYDQAIDSFIEAGVIGEYEEDYLDEDCFDEGYSEECYSEYEFGAVEDDEEEYCFSKELDKVLNDAFILGEGVERKHSHYFKDVRHLDYVDIYQVCKLFEVEDPSHCTQHSIKKLLMSGKRGVKDKMKDIIEARDTLNRYLQIEGIE